MKAGHKLKAPYPNGSNTKTPWYLDKDSGGPNPEVRKPGIAYSEDLS